MILLVIFMFGLIAPFVFVYGVFGWLLVLPFLALFRWGLPYWERLPVSRRKQLFRIFAWTTSALIWSSIVYANR